MLHQFFQSKQSKKNSEEKYDIRILLVKVCERVSQQQKAFPLLNKTKKCKHLRDTLLAHSELCWPFVSLLRSLESLYLFCKTNKKWSIKWSIKNKCKQQKRKEAIKERKDHLGFVWFFSHLGFNKKTFRIPQMILGCGCVSLDTIKRMNLNQTKEGKITFAQR